MITTEIELFSHIFPSNLFFFLHDLSIVISSYLCIYGSFLYVNCGHIFANIVRDSFRGERRCLRPLTLWYHFWVSEVFWFISKFSALLETIDANMPVKKATYINAWYILFWITIEGRIDILLKLLIFQKLLQGCKINYIFNFPLKCNYVFSASIFYLPKHHFYLWCRIPGLERIGGLARLSSSIRLLLYQFFLILINNTTHYILWNFLTI